MNQVQLRAIEPYDIDLLFVWENDRSIWQVSNTLVPFSRYILTKYIESAHQDIYETKQLRMMIDIQHGDKGDWKTIGSIDLFDFDPFHNRAGLGILIGESSYRKKGYASRALDSMIKYSFEVLLLHQLYCNVDSTNQDSLNLFISKGFVITGTKKEWVNTVDGYVDEHLLQLLSNNFSC